MLNFDSFIKFFDQGLRTVFSPAQSARPFPGAGKADIPLSKKNGALSAALMRVNHSGEICAQALYQGQALTAKKQDLVVELKQAAEEETEHLAWTEQRIAELGGRKSFLNPIWYGGSLAIGMMAGLAGDKWSLGFLAETERQVERHLQGHLNDLPIEDERSREVVAQMKIDEAKHATTAVVNGASELPAPVKLAMKLSSKVMTKTAFWI